MFNIKNIVNKFTERGREPSDESLATRSNDEAVSLRTEGFLCPKCMKQLPSAWELQFHYESVHEEEISIQGNMQIISGEVDPEPSMDEEADGGDQDVSLCGDGNNSSLSVEDVPQLTDVQELQELLQQTLNRKTTLESRVMCLVQNNVTLKTSAEEMNRQLFQLRERLKILEAQLAHRESIDDAAVLRQELVQVQRVMDEMNREREKERDNLQAQLLQLLEKDSAPMVEKLKSSLEEKEKQCTELAEKLMNMQLENKENHSPQLKEEESVIHEDFAKLSASHNALLQKNEELTLEIAAKVKLEEQLNKQIKELTKYKNEIILLKEESVYRNTALEKLEQQHKELQEMLKRENNKSMDLSMQLQKQEDAVQLLMGERMQLSQQLESVESAKTHEAEEASRKIMALKSDLEEKSRNQKMLEENLLSQTKKYHHLQNELKTLNESSSTALQVKDEEINTLKAQMDEVAGEKLALEAQLEAIEIEHQKLLERCYASTNEIETLHHSKAELRRKWEECVSALQELGRENATLQLDIEKLLGRKWAEDADVTHCTLCQREFTMLLRKHHCRNCGQIFCNECSSKSAAVVSNKKPVRVCDSCFDELKTK